MNDNVFFIDSSLRLSNDKMARLSNDKKKGGRKTRRVVKKYLSLAALFASLVWKC